MEKVTMTKIPKLLRKIWRYGIRFLVQEISSILDFCYPKDNSLIIFGSDFTNRLSGDPKAMFEDVRKNHPEYRAYFITKTPTEPGTIKSNTLRTLLIFLSARFCVTSHGITDFGYFKWSRRKKVIATWHAITFKSVGYTMKNRTALKNRVIERYTKSVTASIASSKYDAAIHCMMFGYGGRMFLTGHPRNDRLVGHVSHKKEYLRKILPRLSEQTTVILYAPTFRSNLLSTKSEKLISLPEINLRSRGLQLFPFNDFNIETFHTFLEENDIIVLLRLHIGDTATKLEVKQLEENSDRIFRFDYNYCPDINMALGDIDFVVTDYSSIFNDFLLLNRPMMFIPYDLKEYEQQRGLSVDDYDFWTPGPKVSSMQEFIDYVKTCISGNPDQYDTRRRALNRIINAHQTADSTSRILKLFSYLEKGTI